MRALITGGTSPVGAALARKLAADGHQVRILSRGRDHRRLAGLDCAIYSGDITDTAAVTTAAGGCDSIVHAAYAPAGAPARETLRTAARGILAVLEACERQGVRELLLVSSPLAADPHPGSYGTGKLAAEMLAASWADGSAPARLVITRPYNVYGPDCGYDHVIPQLITRMRILASRDARDPLPFPVRGDGSEVRSFLHADDCAARLAGLLAGPAGTCTEDVGTSDPRTIADVARDIAACFGRRITIMPSPLPPGVPGTRVPLDGTPPETPFATGLVQTVAWYREHDQPKSGRKLPERGGCMSGHELGRHEDERGVIQDLLITPLDGVTEIFTRKGAIRGNHVHYQTTQYTYVVSGLLRVVTQKGGGPLRDRVHGPGDMACEAPGVAHAWEALEDTVVLVFTKGPRSGPAYETDTIRLPDAERLLP